MYLTLELGSHKEKRAENATLDSREEDIYLWGGHKILQKCQYLKLRSNRD